MPDWELSERLLAGKGLSHSLERAICLEADSNARVRRENLSLKRGVYHGAGGGDKLPGWLARQTAQTREVIHIPRLELPRT
jgi:hypothetical protein